MLNVGCNKSVRSPFSHICYLGKLAYVMEVKLYVFPRMHAQPLAEFELSDFFGPYEFSFSNFLSVASKKKCDTRLRYLMFKVIYSKLAY